MSRPELNQRLVAIVVILVLHVGVAVFLLTKHRPIPAIPPVAAIAVRAIPAPPVTPDPLVEHVPLARSIEATVVQPSFDIVEPSTGAPPSCDLAAAISVALDRDPAALAALSTVAADPRRAVMLWDGGWLGRRAGDPVRRAVNDVVSRAGRACLDEEQVGPRLLIVPVEGTNIATAIGSGRWNWRQLLSSDTDRSEKSVDVPPEPK